MNLADSLFKVTTKPKVGNELPIGILNVNLFYHDGGADANSIFLSGDTPSATILDIAIASMVAIVIFDPAYLVFAYVILSALIAADNVRISSFGTADYTTG